MSGCEYGNTRLAARRAALLRPEQYEALLAGGARTCWPDWPRPGSR